MSVMLRSLPAVTKASVRSCATCGGVPTMGAIPTLDELLKRLVALLRKPPLGPPEPPPQAVREASARVASAIDAIRLSRLRTCRESAPNKTLPLLAAQHRSRQNCRDGTPNPLPDNSLPASAHSRPVEAWSGAGSNATHGGC